MGMANVLNEEKKQQVLALGRLGWSLRRIQQATKIRRETASAYLKAAGIAVRLPSGWGRCEPKPANEVITDFGAAKPAIAVIPDACNPSPSPNPEMLRLCVSSYPSKERLISYLSQPRNAIQPGLPIQKSILCVLRKIIIYHHYVSSSASTCYYRDRASAPH